MTSALSRLTPERIAIVKPSALGDILHSLPVLTALRRRFPDARITWVVNRAYEVLLDGHPDLDATILLDRHPFRHRWIDGFRYQRNLVGNLRSAKFDLVIDLQGLFRSGVISRLTGAPTRIGLASAREGSRMFYTHVIDDGGDLRKNKFHAVDRYWKIVEALGGGDIEKTFRMSVAPDAATWATERFAGLPRPLLAMGVGARWLTKRWLPAHFAELGRRAQSAFGGTVILVGSPDERPLAEEVAGRLVGPSVLLAGETSLGQLIAALAASDVVVANDTGPLHLAVALGRPVVSPFTCTSVHKTGPYGQFHRAVETTVWCRGHEVRTCSRMECMAELTPDRLWPVLSPLLEESLRSCPTTPPHHRSA